MEDEAEIHELFWMPLNNLQWGSMSFQRHPHKEVKNSSFYTESTFYYFK